MDQLIKLDLHDKLIKNAKENKHIPSLRNYVLECIILSDFGLENINETKGLKNLISG